MRAVSGEAQALAGVPTLLELLQTPERAAELPAEERCRLVSQLAALIVVIESSSARPVEAPVPQGRDSARDDDRLLRVPEAAEILGFARSYIYELIRRGELPAVQSGRHVRLRRSALREWARRHEQLDKPLDTMLSFSRGPTRGSTHSSPPRPHTARARRADWRAPAHGEPLGTRRRQRSSADRAAPPTSRPDGEAEEGQEVDHGSHP